MSSGEIARKSMDAKVVVSVEGSHISHVIYTIADRGKLIVLQPPERFAMPYKEYTDRMEMSFGFTVGTPHEDGFVVDAGKLFKLMEKMQ
jgi:hypothetical protein